MHEELRALLPLLEHASEVWIGARRCHLGEIAGHPVVLVLSGIGKVAAATTASLLACHFSLRALILTGVAGGLAAEARVGDVVVARELVQHDLDASPLYPRYEVPGSGCSHFPTDPFLSDALAAAAIRQLAQAATTWTPLQRDEFGLGTAAVRRGLILSGDRFVSTAAESRALREALPAALAVEMEGAAIAQVCADFRLPFAVLRTISDRADDDAHVDFLRFIAEVASVYTRAVIHDWLMRWDTTPEAGGVSA